MFIISIFVIVVTQSIALMNCKTVAKNKARGCWTNLQALSLSKYSFRIIITRSLPAISQQVNLGVYFHVSLHACGAQLGLGLQHVGLGFILTSGFALSSVLDPGRGSLFCDICTQREGEECDNDDKDKDD